jgi:hypothetical protein
MRDCGMCCAPRIRRERDALSPVVARTEAVMQDQYLEVHPVPRPMGQPQLKLGREPLGRCADRG